ncbi:MAG: 2-dehydro-3-deoxygalactonokinase [Planctomycetaceae bacterium]|nr:2-dehydro-3-deoxygalactonokinase [Planctomycetaceae bacterium]
MTNKQTMAMTALIGLDWGTSNVRGFRYDDGGRVIESRRCDAGLKHVATDAWEATFAARFGDWTQESPAAAVLMCGMVGSKQGWSEAPYVECPASCDALADHLHAIPGGLKWIVPGVSYLNPDGCPDVMRGEETQLAGLEPVGSFVVCLPGTHTKWGQLVDGRIESFQTTMTGELFDVLMKHSLLGRMAEPGDFNEDAFSRGLDRACGSSFLLHDLFSVRTLRLFDQIKSTSVAAYLSGLLVGHEVAGVIDTIAADAAVIIVGTPELSRRYRTALMRWSRPSTVCNGETAAERGLWRIASRARLV